MRGVSSPSFIIIGEVAAYNKYKYELLSAEKEHCPDYHDDFADKKLLPLAEPANQHVSKLSSNVS